MEGGVHSKEMVITGRWRFGGVSQTGSDPSFHVDANGSGIPKHIADGRKPRQLVSG